MMWGPDMGFGPFGGIAHAIGAVIYGLFALACFAVFVAVAVLFVRFLWYATKAAQLYIAKNGPVKTAPATARPAAAPSTTVTPTTPVTKPVTKPRTPPKPPTT